MGVEVRAPRSAPHQPTAMPTTMTTTAITMARTTTSDDDTSPVSTVRESFDMASSIGYTNNYTLWTLFWAYPGCVRVDVVYIHDGVGSGSLVFHQSRDVVTIRCCARI